MTSLPTIADKTAFTRHIHARPLTGKMRAVFWDPEDMDGALCSLCSPSEADDAKKKIAECEVIFYPAKKEVSFFACRDCAISFLDIGEEDDQTISGAHYYPYMTVPDVLDGVCGLCRQEKSAVHFVENTRDYGIRGIDMCDGCMKRA